MLRPQRVVWPPVNGREIAAFLLAIVGITVSWVPSRYRDFVGLPWWEASGLVLAYALAMVVGWGLLRSTYIAGQRLRQYAALWDALEQLEAEHAQARDQVGRLNEVVSHLIVGRDIPMYDITGAVTVDASVDLMLRMATSGGPSVGAQLHIINWMSGELIGRCTVSSVGASYFRARVTDADPFWLGFIHDRIRRHARLDTAAVAVLLTPQEDNS